MLFCFSRCLDLWVKVLRINHSDAFLESLGWALQPLSTQPVIPSIPVSKLFLVIIFHVPVCTTKNSFSIQCLFNNDSLVPCVLEEGHTEDSNGPTPCHAQAELGGSGELHPHRALLGLLALLASQGMLLKHGSAQLSGTIPCPWELGQGPLLQLTQPQCCTFPFCQVITANTDLPAVLWGCAKLIIA